MTTDDGNKSSPLAISVVVPVRNEAASIRDLLERLLSQTLSPAEIVIVDGGSRDITCSIVEEFIEANAPVKLIREANTLPGRARNLGVANVSHKWIAFTDAGTEPSHEWLEMLAQEASNDARVDAVYGAYEPVTDTFFTECAAIAYVPPPIETEQGVMRHTSIVSALMRRKVWEVAGGFPEHLRSGEDLLFMRSVEREGFHIARANRAVVRWHLQPGLWRTFKRFVAYAHSNIRAGLWREWQRATILRYSLILATSIPAIFLGWQWILVPGIAWLAMTAARSIAALRRNRKCYPASAARNFTRLLLLVPIIAVLDAAALIGSVNWLIFDLLSPGGHRQTHAR